VSGGVNGLTPPLESNQYGLKEKMNKRQDNDITLSWAGFIARGFTELSNSVFLVGATGPVASAPRGLSAVNANAIKLTGSI